MSEPILISQSKNNEMKINKRLYELNNLNPIEINKLLSKYHIVRCNTYDGNIVNDLFKSIILHENYISNNKQTDINIDNKSYLVNTINNHISVTKININNKEIYKFNINFHVKSSTFEILYENGNFSYDNRILQKHSNLYNDVKLCRKAILFIESYHFSLKTKYLIDLFDDINDIITNIQSVYFERTLLNVKNINCKLQ